MRGNDPVLSRVPTDLQVIPSEVINFNTVAPSILTEDLIVKSA